MKAFIMRACLVQPLLAVLTIWIGVLLAVLLNDRTPLESIMFWGMVGLALLITVLIVVIHILIRREGLTVHEVVEAMREEQP